MIKKPLQNEYHEFYITYISKVEHVQDIFDYLEVQRTELIGLIKDLTEEQSRFKYADGKWTIKELLRHIIDAENVFAFRAFTISKNTNVDLPGMDQDEYIAGTDDSENSFQDLIHEFDSLRRSTIIMIKNLHKSTHEIIGNANGTPVSVRANLFIIAGHTAHHIEILKERYLKHV